MSLTLTCDHRAVDGADAADFLRTVRSMLEEPGLAQVLLRAMLPRFWVANTKPEVSLRRARLGSLEEEKALAPRDRGSEAPAFMARRA